MKMAPGLCDSISSECRLLGYSGFPGVRVGFVCLTTSSPAHPPKGQSPIGKKECESLDVHFSLLYVAGVL